MNVLIEEDLYDRDYIEQVRDRLSRSSRSTYSDYTPEWVYLETGIRPNVIRETAREMAKAAPATVVHPGRHADLVWRRHAAQPGDRDVEYALLGSWNREGGFYIS